MASQEWITDHVNGYRAESLTARAFLSGLMLRKYTVLQALEGADHYYKQERSFGLLQS